MIRTMQVMYVALQLPILHAGVYAVASSAAPGHAAGWLAGGVCCESSRSGTLWLSVVRCWWPSQSSRSNCKQLVEQFLLSAESQRKVASEAANYAYGQHVDVGEQGKTELLPEISNGWE